ncbi:MAG: OmpA family protein [Kiloniellales bacterium]
MKAKGTLLGVFVALALLAPAKADLIFDDTSGIGLETKGIAFMNALYDGYVALSQERQWATDLVDAEHFNHKARRSARRSSTQPDQLMDRELLDEDKAELAAALARLRVGFDRGGRYVAPADAAKAQVSYDCWIEAAEGTNPKYGWASHSSWRLDDVERCKGDFEAAMAKVEAAANYSLTGMAGAAPAPAVAAVPVSPTAGPSPEPFLLHFAFDSAAIDGAGNGVIDDAVAAANQFGILDFSVTGHADRSGPEAYNLELSLRRANAVRDALVDRGVKSSGISVGGRGEAEPAVPTADGVREQANRRVEIILL